MARDLPPLGHLIAFDAAARLESFTNAARELDLTHGAVSRAVGALESHLRTKLFTRRNRRVFLNARGKILHEAVRTTLDSLRTATDKIRAYSGGSTLVIGAEPGVAAGWLMPLLAEAGGTLTVDVRVAPIRGPIDLTQTGCDAAIVSGRPRWAKDYHSSDLTRERSGPMCHPAYWEQVGGLENAVLLHKDLSQADWFDWADQAAMDIAAKDEKVLPSDAACLREAIAGRGVTIGTLPLAAADLASGRLITPFGLQETDRVVSAVSVDDPDSDPRIAAFLAWLIHEIAQGEQP